MDGRGSEELEVKECRYGSTLIFLQVRGFFSPAREVKVSEFMSDADTSLILPGNTARL